MQDCKKNTLLIFRHKIKESGNFKEIIKPEEGQKFTSDFSERNIKTGLKIMMVKPPLNFSLKFIICILIFTLFTLNSSAQIENVRTPTVICTGKVFTITFDVSNKGNSNSYFTSNTEYTIDLGTLSGAGNSFISTTIIASSLKYTEVTYTADNNTTYQISFDVVMPSNIAANASYAISVSSLNPYYNEKKGYSNTFEVVETPVTSATNSGPYCDTATINLFSTEMSGVIYSWTGPNGYISDVANPTIPNATPAMSGDYNVTVTNLKGCTSFVSTTNVVVTNNITWTGANSTDWNDSSNWSCNFLPKYTSNVIIPTGLSRYPVLSTGSFGVCNNITVKLNASLEISNNNTLQVNGLISSTNVINVQNGTINFTGINAQTIPSSAFLNNQVRNLTISNTEGVTNAGLLNISGTLLAFSGTLNTGNSITLISSAFQTALIDGSGNGQIVGTVKMQRYLDIAFGYKYFSSPFKNSVVNDFEPFMDFTNPSTGFPHFYRYNENRSININDTLRDATGWEVHTGNLNIAEGYALNFGASSEAKTIELFGEVNNGNIPARQLSNNHLEFTKGFHLVGNPYPSPIDWDASQGWTRNNIDNGIYFFTASDDSQYTGTYSAYVNGVSTADVRSSKIIPSMQGFFIKVSDSDTQDLVTGSFGMNNNVRVNDFDQKFLRMQATDQKSLIRIDAGFKATNLKDPLVIYFSSFATPNFEKEMDAHKLMNTNPAIPSFYNLTENKKELAINAIPFPETRSYKKIPLGIKADQNGEMNISLASIENLTPNFNIYLIDHEKGKGQNLRNNPEYSFSIKVGTHNTRFELMFSEEKITNPAIAFNEPFHVEVINNQVVVKLNLEDNQEGILQVSTMIGQVLQIKKGRGQENIVFNGITSDGVYIINLLLGEARYSKKVLIKK